MFYDHILAKSDPKIPSVKILTGKNQNPQKAKIAWLVEEIEQEEHIQEKSREMNQTKVEQGREGREIAESAF